MLYRSITWLSGALAPLLLATGCATITGEATQALEIRTVDAQNRPLRGMTCTLLNGSGEQTVVTPATSIDVRRSSSDLEIECQRDGQIARGTVVARGENKMEHSFIPGGSLLAVIDHVSGYMYSYPTPLVLRAGEHLRFEFSSAARAELVAALTNSAPAPQAAPTISITTVSAAPVTAVGSAPVAAKPLAPSSRTPVAANGKARPATSPAAAAPATAAPPSGADALDARDMRLRSR